MRTKGNLNMKTRTNLRSVLVAFLGVCFLLAGTAHAQDQDVFAPGAKGMLTSTELAEGPMPHWMPLMPSADKPYHYRNIDIVVVSYATDAENAAALIPEDLALIDIPVLPGQAAVNLLFAKYRENDEIGPYMEVVVAIPVLADGIPYLYVPAIYVDNDAAMAAGREFGGYPKKLANITMRNYGDLYLNHMSRGTMQEKTSDPNFSDLASSSVTKAGRLFSVPLPAENINQLPFPYNMLLPLPAATGEPQNFILPTMGLRYLPGVGSKATEADTLQLIGTPWVVTEAEVYAGVNPSMEIYPSEEDPIAQALPFNSVLASYILRGDMYTDVNEWVLFKDYTSK